MYEVHNLGLLFLHKDCCGRAVQRNCVKRAAGCILVSGGEIGYICMYFPDTQQQLGPTAHDFFCIFARRRVHRDVGFVSRIAYPELRLIITLAVGLVAGFAALFGALAAVVVGRIAEFVRVCGCSSTREWPSNGAGDGVYDLGVV